MFLGRNRISLTGASHTREAYDRLPHGWRPAPPGVYADLHMWLQWCAQPWFRGRTGRHVTALHFPDPDRRHLPAEQRVAELESWWERCRNPGLGAELDAIVEEQIRLLAVELKIQTMELKDRVAELERRSASRRLRAKRALAGLAPMRTLIEKRRAAR
jgi:hypothetical protein